MTLNLTLRDETKKKILESQDLRQNRDLSSSISDFKTRIKMMVVVVMMVKMEQ